MIDPTFERKLTDILNRFYNYKREIRETGDYSGDIDWTIDDLLALGEEWLNHDDPFAEDE